MEKWEGQFCMDTIDQYITDLDAELSLNSTVVILEHRIIPPSQGTFLSILLYKQRTWD